AAREYLYYLVRASNAKPVNALWEWADRRGFTNDENAVMYTEFLRGQSQPETAAQLWSKHFSGRDYPCIGMSCVFNGDFEHEPTGSSFDWRFQAVNRVRIERDRNNRYEGQYSVRMEF